MSLYDRMSVVLQIIEKASTENAPKSSDMPVESG